MRPQALQQMRERSDRHGFGRQPRRRWCPACIRRARGRSRPQRLRGGLPDGPGGMLWRRAAARDPRRAGSGGASRSGRREELVFGSERAPRFKRWNLPAARCRRPAAAAVTSRHAPRGTPLNLQSAHKRHPVARPPQAAAHAGAVEHSPIRVTGSQQKHRARLRSGCFAPTAPAPAPAPRHRRVPRPLEAAVVEHLPLVARLSSTLDFVRRRVLPWSLTMPDMARGGLKS